ncbi:MFS transporter [uncultured Ligilactobacillus sp.]|uniref:MDR family MFS transporter n=1 Tax=uncultured Ligilactobacillus sp. TaxID=2837633 RepID=UPI00272C167F|nr:MFS transporter [uncultured Ligilactobacillus sp.]
MAKKELKLSWLLCGSFIVSVGSSLLWPLTTIYMHNYLGQSLTTAGTVLFINSLALIVGSYLGGQMYDKDRKNARRWLLGAIFLSTLAVFLLIFFNGWPIFAVLLLLDNFGGGIAITIENSLATGIKEKSSRQVFNMLYFMQNVGVVIGTLLVGMLVEISIEWIFIINFILFAFFWLVVYRHYYVPKAALVKEQVAKKGHDKTPLRYVWVILAILILFFAIETGYSQWQSNLSIYMESLGISVKSYGFLWTINGLVIVCGQPILNKLLDDILKIKLIYKLYLGSALFVLGFFTLLFATDYPHFILTMVIVTLGEILTFPTIPAVVDNLSTLSEKGKYQGAVSVFAALGRAIGPLAGGLIVDNSSYNMLFTVMIALMGIATLFVIVVAQFNLVKK